ncbi:hypothetical protein GKODMF_12285 [Candidatus Electrothrix gigas]
MKHASRVDIFSELQGEKSHFTSKHTPAMPFEELVEIIWEAREKRVPVLNLRKKGLTSLPNDLFRMPELVILDISGNQLTSLPSQISQLKGLQRLNLSENPLTSLPDKLFQLKNLKALGLGAMNLTALPRKIGELQTLIHLYLHLNKLAGLPPEIGKLANLQELNLWNNPLAVLPREIKGLKKLRYLCLNNNNLANLPPEIGELTNLEKLSLNDNRLVDLPQELCQLTKLKKIEAKRNPFVSPPPEIIRNGIKAIQQYLADLEKGVRPVSEVKLVFIGDGSAGKTSLIRQILGRSFNNEEETTCGIEILRWDAAIDDSNIRVNIWDFGGQDIMHAEHQIFFSKRSLYIIVLDCRMNSRAEYWLQHIRAFGGDSPVILVLNKQDSQLGSCNLNIPFLCEKYPEIREVFNISCKKNQGIFAFKEGLLKELNKVRKSAVCWPGAWFAVKHRIEQIERPWISRDEYHTICTEEGIMNEKVGTLLLDFLHDIGAVVHFKDVCWDAMYVLNPAWAASAIYGVITSKKVVEYEGIIRLQDMANILPDGACGNFSCPTETHAFILELMKKFELCCGEDVNTVLIPQLLPASEPDFSFDRTEAIGFILYYPDFLPASIFPRFMVKAYRDIKELTCWKSGMLLKDRLSDTHALIREDVQIRRICIWVSGRYRKEYLHYLRFLLAAINSDFKGLKIIELLTVPDAPEITADCAVLSEYIKNDLDKYIPTGSTKVYNTNELLDLVQPRSIYELNLIIEKIGLDRHKKAAFADWLFSFSRILSTHQFDLTSLFKEMLDWCWQHEKDVCL